MTYLTQIRFYDIDDSVITEYNPKNRNDDEHEQVLEDNEEIFGVYGVKDKQKYLTTFGFIVKVRQVDDEWWAKQRW